MQFGQSKVKGFGLDVYPDFATITDANGKKFGWNPSLDNETEYVKCANNPVYAKLIVGKYVYQNKTRLGIKGPVEITINGIVMY